MKNRHFNIDNQIELNENKSSHITYSELHIAKAIVARTGLTNH